MKKEALIITVIFGMWIPILASYIKTDETLEIFTEYLYAAILVPVVIYGFFKYLESKLFKPLPGSYWIKAGKHYSDGIFWTKIRNVRFFFFKREIEFWYKLSPGAIQDDGYQKNKIFGITSVFYRRNSIRETFAGRRSFGTFDAYKYVYADKTNYQYLEDLNRKPGVWYHSKLKAPKLIWFGLYHFPYHGGKKPSSKTYSIDIRFNEPS